MTKNQENRVTMFGTVLKYMDKNKALWTGTKAVSDTVAELNTGIADIAAKAGKQQAPTTGAAGDKAQVRLDYEAKILEVGDQIAALAAKKKDANLGAQVDFSKAGLGKLPDDELETTGKRVAGLATANLAALADYGVTQADVTELNGLTTSFNGIKNTPRTAIAGRAGETATLPDLITETTNLLRDQLDKQLTKFRKSEPEFYAGYQTARVVVDRGGSGSAPATPPTPPAPNPA